jgi:hypothetical protein
VGFDHWRGHVHDKHLSAAEPQEGAAFTVEGLDLLLFDGDNRISHILKFDIQDYSKQLKGQEEDKAPAGSA